MSDNAEAAGVGCEPDEWGGFGCECVGYTIRTDYGTGVEHDVDTSSCPVHGDGEDDEDQPCGCDVHPRWCAWNGPCCDDCSHGADEAHAECCPPAISSALPQAGDGS